MTWNDSEEWLKDLVIGRRTQEDAVNLLGIRNWEAAAKNREERRRIVGASGPGSSSGKVLGYGLDGPGSIPGVGGVEIFLHSFVSRLVLGFTQPLIK